MDEIKARETLKNAIEEDNGLYSVSWYLAWNIDEEETTLDGSFNADQLEAIAWWMRNKKSNKPPEADK